MLGVMLATLAVFAGAFTHDVSVCGKICVADALKKIMCGVTDLPPMRRANACFAIVFRGTQLALCEAL